MKKVFALHPDVREEECTHEYGHWTGSMPCTGVFRCNMCPTVLKYPPPISTPPSIHA